MTTPNPADAGAGAAADQTEALREDIARTREQLGETVEALVAKTDVKARAQQKAAEARTTAQLKAAEAKAAAQRRTAEALDRIRHQTRQLEERMPGQLTLPPLLAATAGAAALIAVWALLRSHQVRSR